MAANRARPELIVIVGPTASGKSDLAIQIAKDYNGAIIAADSRTIYKGLDIGTAKPTVEQRAEIPHYGIDLIEPGENFTVSDFKKYAQGKIQKIRQERKLPILVGGTGLYINSIIFDYNFRKKAANKLREELENLSIEQLQQIITKKGYKTPSNNQNKRHLMRVIESEGQESKSATKPQGNVLIIGLAPPNEELRDRISRRAGLMFKNGVLDETAGLVKKYPKLKIGNLGIIYKICEQILSGELSESEAVEKFITADWQYAKRQKTWFKRNPYIVWFNDARLAKKYVDRVLNT